MSLTSPSNNPRFYTDSELQQVQLNDDYKRIKITKDVICYIFIALLIFLTVALVIEYVIDLQFRTQIIKIVLDNFLGIVFFAIGIIGLSISNKK